MMTSLIHFIAAWRRYHRSYEELSRLGDRELADIGLNRSDIPRVAYDAAHF